MTTKNLFSIFNQNFFDLLKSLGVEYVSDISAYDEGTMVTFYAVNKNISTKKLFIMYHQEMRGLYLDKTNRLNNIYSYGSYGNFSNTLYILNNGLEFKIINDYLLKVIAVDSSVVKLKFIYNGELIDLLYETFMLMQKYPFSSKKFNLIFQDSIISIENFQDTLKNIATYRYDYIHGAKENHIKEWCESDIALQRGSMQCISRVIDSNIYDLNSSNECTKLIEKSHGYINHKSNGHLMALKKEEVSHNTFVNSNFKSKSKLACIHAKVENPISETVSSYLSMNTIGVFGDNREPNNRRLSTGYLLFKKQSLEKKCKDHPWSAKSDVRHKYSISNPYRFYSKKNNAVSCSYIPISCKHYNENILNISTTNSCVQNNTQDIKNFQRFERNFFMSASVFVLLIFFIPSMVKVVSCIIKSCKRLSSSNSTIAARNVVALENNRVAV